MFVLDSCSWDNPGHRPYTGDVPAAVRAYAEIPKESQDRLYAKLLKRQYDDLAVITVDKISGAHEYQDLRKMHFGKSQMCTQVTRTKWGDRKEVGLVYCDGQYCLIVPTVCRNVSLVTRVPVREPAPAALPATPPEGGGGGGGTGAYQVPVEPLPAILPLVEPETWAVVPYTPVYPPTGGGGGGWWIAPPPPIPPIPEPSTWLMFLTGLACMFVVTKYRKSPPAKGDAQWSKR